MQTDGQTDMTKLIIAFRSFANAPKIKTHNYTLIFKPYLTENPLNLHYKDHYTSNKPMHYLEKFISLMCGCYMFRCVYVICREPF
jgi:hypothetical protein